MLNLKEVSRLRYAVMKFAKDCIMEGKYLLLYTVKTLFHSKNAERKNLFKGIEDQAYGTKEYFNELIS